MSKYRVLLNGQLQAESEWPPLAQAAWDRAARNRDAAQHGGLAELWRGNERLAQVQPQMGRGAPWPDRTVPECGLRDVVKAILLVLRDDGWDAKEVATAMTDLGLPTTRGRIDALRGSQAGKRAEVTPAELVVMLQAVLAKYRASGESEGIATPDES